MRANTFLAGVFLAILVMPLSFADFPGDWWGQVYIGGELVPDGTPVSAYVNGVLSDSTLVGERLGPGYYEFIIDDAKAGDTITFKIGSVEAEQTAVFSDGSHDRLDITLANAECGDSICNGAETSDSCEADCGSPPVELLLPDGTTKASYVDGRSLGDSTKFYSSGAASSTNGEETGDKEYADGASCLPEWSCGEWSGCIEGVRSRTCTDINGCETDRYKPEETAECALGDETAPFCGDGICSPDEDCPEDCFYEVSALDSGLFAMTGRFLENTNLLWVIGLPLLFILLLAYLYYQRQKSGKPGRK
ncbi:MAG: hypothetical protein ACP5E4_01275 [Candidatus Aenigmatarchaeota archaeon]